MKEEHRLNNWSWKDWFWILICCFFSAWILGISDYGLGMIISPAMYSSEELNDAFSSFFFAQGIFSFFGIGLFLLILLLRLFKLISRDKIPSLIAGIYVGADFFFLFLCFSNSHTDWMMGLGIGGFLVGAVFIGLSFYRIWEKYGRDFQEKCLLILLVWAGLTAGINFILLIFINLGAGLKIRLITLLIAGIIFSGFVVLGLISLRKKKRWVGIFLILVFTGFFLALIFSKSPEARYELKGSARNPKNVILIIADTCRVDALGVYGGGNSTPTLDQLAREGVWFKNVFAQASWTAPSIASLFTSQYPYQFRLTPYLYEIPEDAYLLAERLREHGYFTFGLVGNWILTKRSGYLQGFKQTFLMHQTVRFSRRFSFLPVSLYWQRIILKFFHLRLFPDVSKIFTERVIKFLKNNPPQPFFLYIHYIDPHHPYDPPVEYISHLKYQGKIHSPYSWGDEDLFYQDLFTRFVKQDNLAKDPVSREYVHQLYLAEVRYLDHQLQRLVRTLKELGLEQDTLLIFTADHGEEFWEHGDNQHGRTLYQEQLRVPLIIWGAGIKGGKVEFPVDLIDLVPSLCEYLGIGSFPSDQGRSFWGAISGLEAGSGIFKDYHFAEGGFTRELIYSVQNQDYKLIYFPERKKYRYELYDLKADPGEQKNIFSPAHPGFLLLEKEFNRWLSNNQKLKAQFQLSLTPSKKEAIKQKLRSVGYIK